MIGRSVMHDNVQQVVKLENANEVNLREYYPELKTITFPSSKRQTVNKEL